MVIQYLKYNMHDLLQHSNTPQKRRIVITKMNGTKRVCTLTCKTWDYNKETITTCKVAQYFAHTGHIALAKRWELLTDEQRLLSMEQLNQSLWDSREAAWLMQYNKLEVSQTTNGHIRIPISHDLGKWVNSQRGS